MSGANNTPPENGRTISNPEPSQSQPPADIVCLDPEDSSLPCPLCDGKGVFLLDLPLDDPRYGKFQRCPNHPVGEDKQMLARLRRYGNLEAYQDKTFASFDTRPFGGSAARQVAASLRQAKEAARQYADDPRGWILFEGAYGCGKTHLAVAICNRRLEQAGHQAIFVTAPDLLDFLRSSIGVRGDDSYDDYFERIRNVALLLIDDLGLENPSAWAKEKLFQLLNYRHVNKLPTVITTNRSVDDFDPWLSSRLMDAQVQQVKIDAPDYRRRHREQASQPRALDLQLYSQMRFDTFDTSSVFGDEAENLRRLARLTREWAGKPQGWLCLMGAFGCGKTHLAAAIANQLREDGKTLAFYAVPDLLDALRQALGPQEKTRFDIRLNEILEAPILILDDFRLASATPWAKDTLFQIIDYRYLARMPTVITTPETMDEMDERVATRLMDRRVCLPFAIQARSYVKRVSRPPAKP